MLVTLVQLQQLPPLCLAHWELAFFLQGKPVLLAVQLPAVRVATSHTPQLDSCCLVEPGVVVELAMEEPFRLQHLSPVF
jgi:hypothetical protein